MSNEYTREDYHKTIESIAREALSEYAHEEDRRTFIIESVDSNSYIIMYAGPPVVKEASNNFPTDMREITAMAGDGADFDQLLQVAAYMAMEADVYQAVEELEDDFKECNKCGCMIDMEDEDRGSECEKCGDWFCDGCLHARSDDLYCKDCLEDTEPEPDHETDAFYTPSGTLGARSSASFAHKHLGEFDSDEAAMDAIREHGKIEGFYPSVWFIDDHGGYCLEEDFSYDG